MAFAGILRITVFLEHSLSRDASALGWQNNLGEYGQITLTRRQARGLTGGAIAGTAPLCQAFAPASADFRPSRIRSVTVRWRH